MHDLLCIFAILALAAERELVLWLSVWDLVDSEPLIGGTEETWQMSLNILDIIQLGCQWIVDINNNDLPVGFALVQQCHDAQDFDLLDLTSVADQLADLADVQWIIVTLSLGLGMDDVRIFPSLVDVSLPPICLCVS